MFDGITLLLQPCEFVRNDTGTYTMRPVDFPPPEDTTPSRGEGCLILSGVCHETAVDVLSRNNAKLVFMRRHRDIEIGITFATGNEEYWTQHAFISKTIPAVQRDWAMAHAIVDALSRRLSDV